MQYLRQSTAATVKLGPFINDTDGKTAATGLTISQADIRLSKNGGNIAQTHNAAGATHDELGYYDVPLDTTDTDTIGRLRIAVHESGALPVWEDCVVLDEAVYDVLFGTTAPSTLAAGALMGLADGAITADKVATGAIDADALAADAGTEIAAAVKTAVEAAGSHLALIKAKTDNLPASPAAVGSQMDLVNAPNATALGAIADKFLGRSLAGGADTGRTVRQALRALRNKVTRSGSTLTVYQEDDSTSDWTATLSTSASAEPITGIDPS